jgi:hypothetical protein
MMTPAEMSILTSLTPAARISRLPNPGARAWHFAKTLPDSKTRAIWALALFAAVQVADGVLTSLGIARFGMGIEGNPLLVRSMIAFGSGSVLLAAKSIAILGGSVLHAYSYHLLLAVLTVGYVFATVLPWALLLG